MNHRLSCLPVLATVALSVTACSVVLPSHHGVVTPISNPAGRVPRSASQHTTGGSAEPAGPDAVPSGIPLRSLDPCRLLGATITSRYELTQLGSARRGGASACEWQHQVPKLDDIYEIQVTVRPDSPLAEVNTSSTVTSSINVGRFPGLEGHDIDSRSTLCTVYIGVGRFSRVEVEADNDRGASTSCPLAERFANLVAAALPAQ
jgi:hypothetical protein